MTDERTLQQENILSKKIVDFLTYFKEVRRIKVRDLAERLHYKQNYLTQVRNGDAMGGEKLLHALETFYQLDNLKQIQEKQRQIEDLKREIAVLSEATIEKFYAERSSGRQFPHQPAAANAAFNEGQNPKVIISSGEISLGRLMGKAIVAAKKRKIKAGGKE